MKNFKTIAIALLITISTVANAQTKKIDVSKSSVKWVGKKVTGQHEGTINLKDGFLVFKGKKLNGGTLTVDQTSIEVTDLKAGQGKEKLEGHLKADDFFGTDTYATSKLIFKKIASKPNGIYTITGDLTIKDVTTPITFDLTVKGTNATTTLKIDRTKYGIKYGSGSFFDNLGDKTISDEFELTVSLQF